MLLGKGLQLRQVEAIDVERFPLLSTADVDNVGVSEHAQDLGLARGVEEARCSRWVAVDQFQLRASDHKAVVIHCYGLKSLEGVHTLWKIQATSALEETHHGRRRRITEMRFDAERQRDGSLVVDVQIEPLVPYKLTPES